MARGLWWRGAVFTVAVATAAPGCSSGGEPPSNGYRDMGVTRDLDPPGDGGGGPASVRTERLFPTEEHPKMEFSLCVWASPLSYASAARGEEVVVAGGDGRVVGLDPGTGQPRWSMEMPAPADERAVIVSTPAKVDGLLVVGYHTAPVGEEPLTTPRMRHRVAVVDLEAKALAAGFEEPVELEGSFEATVAARFHSARRTRWGRAQLAHGRLPGDALGKVYVTFGNSRDIQPWHGFAFEVDLDRWRAEGAAAAVTGSLVTTPEADCGPVGQSGSRDRICGGGLWAPSGPLVLQEEGGGYSLILAPGNGQLDLERGDYANTLMRVGPGLDFDPGCDEEACQDFDPDEPSRACVESCRDLFVPRRRPEDGPLRPETGVCQGLTMFQCWEELDYIGGSTPAAVTLPGSGRRVLAYPTKDGAVYLVDADHLGTLLDREQLVAVCGTADSPCRWDWAGMIVTEPAVVELDGRPVLLVATFMPDEAHPAGVVALEVVEDGGTPQLEVLWQAPHFGGDEAMIRFRQHPTRIALQHIEGHHSPVAWVAETFRREQGRLLGIRVWDGAILEDRPLVGSGMRFVEPLVLGDRIYLSSCSEAGEGAFVEGYQVEVE